MFLEIYKPTVVDLTVTRDRVKLRITEPNSPGKFWLNLTFNSKDELKAFLVEINTELMRESDEFHKVKE